MASDMKVYKGISDEDVEDRVKWRLRIGPQIVGREGEVEEEEEDYLY